VDQLVGKARIGSEILGFVHRSQAGSGHQGTRPP
jgi:hypothetical protein